MEERLLSRQSDKVGVFSSLLCLAHCLALPLLMSSHGLTASVFSHDWHFVEYVFLAVSFVAVYYSTRHQPLNWVKVSFYLVLAAFTVGFVFEAHWAWLKYLGYFGSLGLIGLHLYNYYQNRLPCRV